MIREIVKYIRRESIYNYKQGPQNHRTSEKKPLNIQNPPTGTTHFNSCNHQKWLIFKTLGDTTVKKVQIHNDGYMVDKVKREIASQ